jgi:hypothetical protein
MCRGSFFHGQLPLPGLPKSERQRLRNRYWNASGSIEDHGTVKYYGSKPDSGHALSRGFCPECGSHLFAKTSAIPDLAMIAAGSLDDPTLYKPTVDIFTSSAQPWDHMDPALASSQNAADGRLASLQKRGANP